MLLGLQNLHLSNGSIKFGQGFESITAVGQLSTIRLTDMKLIVVPGLEPDLADLALNSDECIPVLEASGHKKSLILENCTFEATFDSPALDRLVGCMAKEGARVGLSMAMVHPVLLFVESLPPFASSSANNL
jgi:hypothetical protein